MPLRIHWWLAVLLASVWLGAGCRGPAPASTGESAGAAKVDSEDRSPEAAERRAEAQARYASAWLHYLNEENDEALDDYLRAGLLDPDNETLVLEVTQRLLQFKKQAEATNLLEKACRRPSATGLMYARLAMLYALAGKKSAAMEANRQAIKRSPHSLLGYQYLAQLQLQNNQPAEALKTLEQAAQQSDVDASFLIDLAEAFIHVARAGTNVAAPAQRQALESLNRAEALKPTSATLLQRMAERYADLGDMEKASAAYARLAERFPSLPGVRRHLFEYYLRKDDYTNATVQARAIVRQDPTDPGAHRALGELLMRQMQPEEAMAAFRNVVLLSTNLVEDYHNLARAQIAANKPKDALETLNRAPVKLESASSFRTELFKALACQQLRDFTNAIVHLNQAEVIARGSATNFLTEDFYIELAQAQIQADQTRDALETLAGVRARFKDSPRTELIAAAAYSRRKDYSNAVARLLVAESFARQENTNLLNAEFYFRLAAAYERNQQFKEAEKTFRKVIHLAPDFSEALNYLGYMWAERGENLREARRLIEKAVKAEPKNAAFLDSMAWVLYKLNEPKEALSWMLKAVENIEEPDATLFDHLGDIYGALKQTDKAREAWQKALSLEPSAELRRKLESSLASPAPHR
jgi:tetratricopeptide (TPR) repeat protein